jgi:hypothetical protein
MQMTTLYHSTELNYSKKAAYVLLPLLPGMPKLMKNSIPTSQLTLKASKNAYSKIYANNLYVGTSYSPPLLTGGGVGG